MNTYNNSKGHTNGAVYQGGQGPQVRSDIDKILEQEAERNNKETWSKLDKTTKINKLSVYASNVGSEKNLTEEDITLLSKYLVACLERKRLLSVKDVVYDNEIGEIKNIPSLVFSSSTTRKFTLKRLEKRASTLKSLGPGKGKGKKKIGKIDMDMN
tara:strand:- start:1003 stop:1470 length:468 start_codon:yes stop_codon:yes gene_type:complete